MALTEEERKELEGLEMQFGGEASPVVTQGPANLSANLSAEESAELAELEKEFSPEPMPPVASPSPIIQTTPPAPVVKDPIPDLKPIKVQDDFPELKVESLPGDPVGSLELQPEVGSLTATTEGIENIDKAFVPEAANILFKRGPFAAVEHVGKKVEGLGELTESTPLSFDKWLFGQDAMTKEAAKRDLSEVGLMGFNPQTVREKYNKEYIEPFYEQRKRELFSQFYKKHGKDISTWAVDAKPGYLNDAYNDPDFQAYLMSLPKTNPDRVRFTMLQGVEALPAMGVDIATMIANAPAGIASTFLSSYEESRSQLEQKLVSNGVTPSDAERIAGNRALVTGALKTALEFTGNKKLIDVGAKMGKGAVKVTAKKMFDMLGTFGFNVAEEQVQTFVDTVSESNALMKQGKEGVTLDDAVDRQWDTFIGSLIPSGVGTGGSVVLQTQRGPQFASKVREDLSVDMPEGRTDFITDALPPAQKETPGLPPPLGEADGPEVRGYVIYDKGAESDGVLSFEPKDKSPVDRPGALGTVVRYKDRAGTITMYERRSEPGVVEIRSIGKLGQKTKNLDETREFVRTLVKRLEQEGKEEVVVKAEFTPFIKGLGFETTGGKMLKLDLTKSNPQLEADSPISTGKPMKKVVSDRVVTLKDLQDQRRNTQEIIDLTKEAKLETDNPDVQAMYDHEISRMEGENRQIKQTMLDISLGKVNPSKIKVAQEKKIKRGAHKLSDPPVNQASPVGVPAGHAMHSTAPRINKQGEKYAFYKPQGREAIMDQMQKGSDGDLRNMYRDKDLRNNERVAAAVTLLDRFDSDSDEYNAIASDLFNIGEDLGQGVNMFNELASTMVAKGGDKAEAIINRKANKILDALETKVSEDGTFALKPKERLFDALKLDIRRKAELKKARLEHQQQNSPESSMKYAKAEEEVGISKNRVNAAMNDALPKTYMKILTPLMQGSVLEPKSLLRNVIYYGLNTPIESVISTIHAGLDQMFSSEFIPKGLREKRTKSYSPREDLKNTYEAAVKEGVPKAVAAFKDWKERLRGQEPGDMSDAAFKVRGELHRSLDIGMRGWKRAMDEDEIFVGKDGKPSRKQKHIKMMEATLGIYPELMFRGLYAGDIIPKAGNRNRIAQEEARLAVKEGKIRPDEMEDYISYPPEDVRERIEQRTLRSVFQEDTPVSRALETLAKKHPVLNFMMRLGTQSLFVKTPINLINRMVEFAIPELLLAKAGYYSRTKNTFMAEDSLARYITYSGLRYVGGFLVGLGLVTPPPDEKDESVRSTQYKVYNPGSINKDATIRVAKGVIEGKSYDELKGLAERQVGDLEQGLENFGVAGLGWLAMAKEDMELNKKGSREAKARRSELEEWYFDKEMKLSSGINAYFELPMMTGLAKNMRNLSQGNFDRIASDWIELMSHTVAPSVTKKLSKDFQDVMNADVSYLSEKRSTNKLDQFANIAKSKSFGALGGMPNKIDNWGREIETLPEEEGSYLPHALQKMIYRYIDPFNAKRVGVNEFDNQIWKIYEETGDARVMPTMPKFNKQGRTLSSPNTRDKTEYFLNNEEFFMYRKMLGTERKKMAEDYLNSIDAARDNAYAKVNMLSRLYRKAKIITDFKMLDELKNKGRKYDFDAMKEYLRSKGYDTKGY